MGFKNIKDLKEKNIRIKALEVAHGLCILYSNNTQSKKNAEHTIEQIYRCVHVALDDCEESHDDWLEGLEEIYNDFLGVYIDDR